MISTTKAIVLRIIPYSDSKNILNCYSPDFGRVSFVCFKPKGKKRWSAGYFHLLALVEVVFAYHEKKHVHTARSVQHTGQLQSLLNNPAKLSIAIFLAEFLNSVLQEEDANALLYTYMENFIFQLNESVSGYDGFHLKFMLELASYTGFFPELDLSGVIGNGFLNLSTGELDDTEHTFSLSKESGDIFKKLISTPYESLSTISIGAASRTKLLNELIRFYSIHFPDFKEPASLKIFRGY